MNKLDSFLETALWSTSDYSDGADYPENLDANYSICDVSEAFQLEAQKMIDAFMIKATPLFTESELATAPIGHDLWLTLEEHGAGFWDGDYENGDALTKLCEEFQKYSWGDKLNENIERGN